MYGVASSGDFVAPGACAEEDDRQIAETARPELVQQLVAAHARHAHVEDRHVRRTFRVDAPERLRARLRSRRCVSGVAQLELDERQDVGVVVDYEHARHYDEDASLARTATRWSRTTAARSPRRA
jgi:hypothetical protein